jgi:hypothetical protein
MVFYFYFFAFFIFILNKQQQKKRIMFAILGMNFMKGKLNYCDFPGEGKEYNLYAYDRHKVIKFS